MQHIETVHCDQISPQVLQQETKTMETSATALATTVQPSDTGGSNVMTPMSLFNFDGFDVRIQDDQEALVLSLKRCARSLGYSNTRDAISKHCKGVAKRDYLQKVECKRQQLWKAMSIVSSSGPNSPAAQRFEDWVTSEVLPPSARQVPMIQFSSKPSTTPPRCFSEQITRTPMSPRHLTHQQKPLFNFQRRTRICNEKRQFCKRGQKHLNKKPTKTDRKAFKRLAGSKGTFSLTEAAKALKSSPRAFNLWMAAHIDLQKKQPTVLVGLPDQGEQSASDA